jgi:hypothetical protein
VPRAHIADAQARLAAAGWQETALDAHDQRYYREWSHELPPMRHPIHGLELDLHHNILPPIARTRVDADALLAHLHPCHLLPPWQVLQPVDQLLHSAAHLFHDSELHDRLRDLVDQDALLRHFGAEAGFWDALPARAEALGLQQSLALCLHFCQAWLGTPVPAPVARWARGRALPAAQRAWLLPVFAAALWPTDVDRLPGPGHRWASRALLVRHHWGRMPLKLLLPHLWHKLRQKPEIESVSTPVP